LKDISSISLTLSAKNLSIYTDGSVTVNIKAKSGSYIKKDRFSCFIYTDDYYPICNSDESGKQLPINGGCIDIEIQSHKIWLPGDYILFVLDETTKSQLRIDFCLDDRLRVICGEPKECNSGSLDYVLTSCVENSDANWDVVATAPGAAQLRRYVLECNQFKNYNKLRKQLNVKELKCNRNLLIYTYNQDWSVQTLEMFKKLCVFGTYFTHIDCSSLNNVSSVSQTLALDEKFKGTNHVYCLTNLSSLLASDGKMVVKKVEERMQDEKGLCTLWLCGSRQEIDSVMEVYPLLREFFLSSNRLEQQPYTGFEIVHAFISEFEKEDLMPTDEVKDELSRAILKCQVDGSIGTWSLSSIHHFIVQDVLPRYVKRAINDIVSEDISPLTMEDIDLSLLPHTTSAFEDSIKELDRMVGLDDIKQSIITMANQARFCLERRRAGFPTSDDTPRHAIFTGNPGTGKTTVAKMIGRIYHSLGVLSKGEVICADRTRLVGRYVGETENNMKIVLAEAHGNVLFIDEAYNLYDGADDRQDYGNHVLDSLLTVLAQPNPDMVIILAGYEKEMDAMLNSNPGLSGRFTYKYRFNDYNAEQLMEIACNLFNRDQYVLTDEAKDMLTETISETVSQRTKNFGNARWVEQFVKNGIIPAMADRVIHATTKDYQHILVSDVVEGYKRFNPNVIELKPRRKVGFSA
jgi:AAA+ superfamily predicted ATPase